MVLSKENGFPHAFNAISASDDKLTAHSVSPSHSLPRCRSLAAEMIVLRLTYFCVKCDLCAGELKRKIIEMGICHIKESEREAEQIMSPCEQIVKM